MIELTKTDVLGIEHAIRGMRNPMNSWDKSDSFYCREECSYPSCSMQHSCYGDYVVGNNDYGLMMKLADAGTDHRKFMRMITVYVDIKAPLYWWKEFDTYKVGTVANSCSTMHKIQSKEIELTDFSFEEFDVSGGENEIYLSDMFVNVVADCEALRLKYIETGDKKYWRGLIQLLPTSYNQKRTVMLNYEVLANIYKSRKNHKLDEWHKFCDWIEKLPYSELIIGGDE